VPDPEPEPEVTAAPSDQIGIEPPTATVIWGKENKRQDSVGFEVPWQTVGWPKPKPQPKPPTYVSWGRREVVVAEATAKPEVEK
jgi:hypothetical protein